MQKSPLVRVRGSRWRVVSTRALEDCQLVTLTSAERAPIVATRRVLVPFDEVTPISTSDRPRFASRRRCRRALRTLVADAAPPGALRAAINARIDLLPHQLEPALAVRRGLATRLLLCDEVGLGKTIQAGLVVAELLAMQSVERILVLTPAGLRGQWASELAARFDIHAVVADASTLRHATAALPIGANPWTTMPIAIGSIDYVKRPDVLPAVRAARWDVVIVDEAHGASNRSDRHDAVRALTTSAAYVLLLTATPHNGDTEVFDALCRLGQLHHDPLVVFRRTRNEIGDARRRRVRTLVVRTTAAERRTFRLLDRYCEAVRAEHGERCLSLSVLYKRALSTPWSLARSIERRLQALQAPATTEAQLALPLFDPDGELDAGDEAPQWPAEVGLADPNHERRLLSAILDAAQAADRDGGSKVRAISRMLRRVREPAIVFTEYRDTLLRLRSAINRPTVLLHGGLSRADRDAAVADFTSRADLVLLATDAGGEGLNLQHRCRLVISLELPWNPMRLEQRIGRVDRIGQLRTVHAIHVVGRRTREADIRTRLHARIAQAAADVGAPNPLNPSAPLNERRVARLVLLGDASIDGASSATESRPPLHFDRSLVSIARAEAVRLAAVRMLSHRGERATASESWRPLLGRGRSHQRRALAGRALWIWRLAIVDATDSIVDQQIVCTAAGRIRLRQTDLRSLVDALRTPMSAVVAERSREWCRTAIEGHERFWRTRLDRERAIEESLTPSDVRLVQPGLFDWRVARERDHGADRSSTALAAHQAHRAMLERAAAVTVRPPELVLVLLP